MSATNLRIQFPWFQTAYTSPTAFRTTGILDFKLRVMKINFEIHNYSPSHGRLSSLPTDGEGSIMINRYAL